MQLGMVGLGRMGANMVRRLMRAGHTCVVYDVSASAVEVLVGEGATGAASLEDFVAKLQPPEAAWVMVPAGYTGETVDKLAALMSPGDIIIDGGNSHYHDDIHRADSPQAHRACTFIDVGTSGGVFGLERGYCLMIGGEAEAVDAPGADLRGASRPGMEAAPRTPGRAGAPRPGRAGVPALRACGRRPFRQDGPQRDRVRDNGGLRRGPRHPCQGQRRQVGRGVFDAENTPLADPEYYQYDLDMAEVTEVWRRGSVVASWLLDLTAARPARVTPNWQVSRAGSRTRARGAGRSRPPSTRPSRPTC